MFGHRCVYRRVINFDHAQIYVSHSVRSSVSLSAWLSVSPSVYKLPPSLVRCTSMSKFPFTIYPASSLTHTEYDFGVHTIFKLGKAPFPAPNTQPSALSPSSCHSFHLTSRNQSSDCHSCLCQRLHMCTRYVCVSVWRNFLIYFLANGSRPLTFQVRALPTPNKLLMEISKYWFSVACKNFCFPSLQLIRLSLFLDTQLTFELYKFQRWRLMAKVAVSLTACCVRGKQLRMLQT